jgi:hypothetical protein
MNKNAVIKFDEFYREMLRRTCLEWGYDMPPDEYLERVYKRLPSGLREAIGIGLLSGLVIDAGKTKRGSAAFRPVSVDESKGPYAWYERNSLKKQPQPCWEYYVQLAEYIRLHKLAEPNNLSIKFEDDLMDIGIYRHDKLLACCEVKEKSSQAQKLIDGVMKYQNKKTLPDEDRGNDPLRKAKYISKLKPNYFYLLAIGRRYEFKVDYPKGIQFQLIEDFVPFL